jgi:hypothetical protein
MTVFLVAIERVPEDLPYLLPIVFSWIFSIPLAVWTGSPALGDCLIRLGLFLDCLTADEKGFLGPLITANFVPTRNINTMPPCPSTASDLSGNRKINSKKAGTGMTTDVVSWRTTYVVIRREDRYG